MMSRVINLLAIGLVLLAVYHIVVQHRGKLT